MSTTASDWVTGATVDPAILDRWPGYRVHLIAGEVDPTGLAALADELVERAVAAARSLEGDDPHVLRWRDAYRDFGVKPRVARSSVDALLRRAVSEPGLPRIHALVDVYNAVSVLYRVPIGGEDLERYDGPPRLVVATGDEPFHTTVDGEPAVHRPEPGEPVWVDGGGVTCRRWNWRQTTRTAIEPTTRRVGFIIDSLDAPAHDAARRAAEHLAGLLADVHTRIV